MYINTCIHCVYTLFHVFRKGKCVVLKTSDLPARPCLALKPLAAAFTRCLRPALRFLRVFPNPVSLVCTPLRPSWGWPSCAGYGRPGPSNRLLACGRHEAAGGLRTRARRARAHAHICQDARPPLGTHGEADQIQRAACAKTLSDFVTRHTCECPGFRSSPERCQELPLGIRGNALGSEMCVYTAKHDAEWGKGVK